MTQSQVAERTNYALSTISAYENGTRIPSADFAQRADRLFGTGPAAEDDEGELEGLQKLVETVPTGVRLQSWCRTITLLLSISKTRTALIMSATGMT
jgi:transcriptional regulator with XRE-family HTH domain